MEINTFSKIVSLDEIPEIVNNALSECGCDGTINLIITEIPKELPRKIRITYNPPICDLEEHKPE